MLKLAILILLSLLVGACHRNFVIHPVSDCWDVDKDGHKYPINTHFPAVKRICKS